MKKRKSHNPTSTKSLRTAPYNFIGAALVLMLALSGSFYLFRHLFLTSPYFNVKQIVVRGCDKADLSYLTGRNIFQVDIDRQAQSLSSLYPTYQKIRVVRMLPDRIFVDCIRRIPLACVRLHRDFCVDEDLVLFDPPYDVSTAGLPLITGLETKIFGPKSGKIYKIKELKYCVEALKSFNRYGGLRNFHVSRINVGSANDMSLFISAGTGAQELAPQTLEVRVDQGRRIRDKMRILSDLLVQMRQELSAIDYIEFRFREPTIKLKGS